jgi:putative methyltransferase (TIGR04325 family)
MNLKILLKQFLPPALITFWHMKGLHLGYYWRGVYSQFRQAPSCGPGFASDEWITIVRDVTKRTRDAAERCGTIPPFAGDRAMLPFLAATIGAPSERIAILDFGGGMGADYVHVTAGLPRHWDIAYHLVESPRVCETGAALWTGDARIHFYSFLPPDLQVDIVYIRSSLQYVEDYQGLLRQLAGYRPRYFLLIDQPAGDIPTYVTAQYNVKGSVYPYRFFNVREIIGIMAQLGYVLVFTGRQEKQYDRSNFPPSHRLEQMSNLLFEQRPAH